MARPIFSLQELKNEGFKIYLLEINRLQSIELITSLVNDLKNGERIIQPLILVDLRIVLSAGRRVINPRSAIEKKKRIIESVDDLSTKEKHLLDEGKLLVIFDGNHRFTAVNAVLESKDIAESGKCRIKEETEFLIDYKITESDLNQKFLDINTRRSSISNEDFLPYIIQAFISKKGPYLYDLALQSLMNAGKDNLKSKEYGDFVSFNYKAAQYLCNGCDKLSPLYNKIDRLKEIAINGKDKIADSMITSSLMFENLIIIPYIFEVEFSGKTFKKSYKKLIYKDQNSFVKLLMTVFDRKIDCVSGLSSKEKNAVEDNFLSIFCSFISEVIAKDDFLNEYLEIKGDNLCTEYRKPAQEKRKDLICTLFDEYIHNLDSEKINKCVEDFETLRNNFDNETTNLIESEKCLYDKLELEEAAGMGTAKANYVSGCKSLFKNKKLSVLAMYNFKRGL